MLLVPVSRNASDLARNLDRLFDDGFDRLFRTQSGGSDELAARSPALDVAESDRGYTVTVDLPGVAKNQVKIAIDGRRVNVEAEVRRDDEKKDGDKMVYRERSVSRFARSFTLPIEVDQAASSAKLDNGVLTLSLAKRNAGGAAQLTVS